ncbi:hypothetical protein [Fibrella forsythiae]|uniref:Uncharacterized protein n=1 Tax=Fibrella forsythiae TaxID=2817061 RepID=A0ABS3JQ40_9BACT|nr:hypothetical protein [Fibrella forsythiae]MBO0952121.1 hypothetical protein [Fibrella forsythiae]
MTGERLLNAYQRYSQTKSIRVRIEEIQKPDSGQQNLLEKMQSLRERMAQTPIVIHAGLDINDIIDGVNDNSL